MDVMRMTCGTCCGTGRTLNWKIVFKDDKTGIGTAQSEEVVCESCNGKGYIEYTVFSVEEAKAILKHCGLSAEN